MRNWGALGVVAIVLIAGSVALVAAPLPAESARMVRAKDLISDDQWMAAIPVLRAAAADPKEPNKDEALFWLAQKASREASKAITEALDRDPDTEVKKKAVFALSQLPKDEGVPLLIQVARTNANPAVRKQAMFWLGQSKDPRALKFFEDVLTK